MPTPAPEIDLTVDVVRELLAEQHPDLADQPLVHVASGWDNEIFRLGGELTVRLPRRAMAAPLVLHEQRWLPVLAPALPLPVPVPVRVGGPSDALRYPWPWSVGPWLAGLPAEQMAPADPSEAADALGRFLAALHQPAPADAPQNPYRGVPLVERSAWLERDLVRIGGRVDAPAVRSTWASVVESAPWSGPALWLHGDVHPLNLLVHEGRLSAVIDFGDLTSGDPASDLAVAWMLLPSECRPVLRAAYGGTEAIDVATWARAKGWALALGVAMACGDDRVRAIGERTVGAVLADSG